jgi:hypothetical protein
VGDRGRDSGSATPLILGMVACLLLLAAGLTAATSAFLSQQRLRNSCDGAAVAAGNAAAGATEGLDGTPASAAGTYLRIRSPEVTAVVDIDGGTVTLTCRTTAEITFGALFGAGHLDQHVVSVASAEL